MGYTHYWKFKQNPKDIEGGAEKFKAAVGLFKEGIKLLPKTIMYDDEEIPLTCACGLLGCPMVNCFRTNPETKGKRQRGSGCRNY